MGTVRAFLSRVGGVFDKQQDSDLVEEMEFHLQMQIADNLLAGMTPAEARRRALVKSGGIESAREAYRDRRGFPLLEALWRDLRYAIRMLRKSPVFTSVVVTTLAVGIGANTALFSLVDAVLLRPLPYPNAQRLAVLGADDANRQGVLVSYPNYLDWKKQSQTLSDLAICTRDSPVTLTGAGAPERVDAAQASPNLFAVLAVAPLLGRSFSAEEEQQERPVAVISYNLWQRWSHGTPDVLGRSLTMDGQPTTVVGVMPRSFQFPSRLIQLWRPANKRSRTARARPFGIVVGRLRPDAGLADAKREVPFAYRAARMIALPEQIAGKPIRMALWSLFGAVSFVLLIGCTNVSNLLLARGTVRQHELAIRSALGASRRRLLGQLMVENVLLCSVAGGLGISLASFALRALVAFAPAGTPRLEEVAIDDRVLSFTLIVSCLCTLIFGLFPALQITRCDPQNTLKGGGGNALQRPPGRGVQSLLTIGEFALALVLLCGAGLMLRSLVLLHQVPLGFEARNASIFRVASPNDSAFPAEALRRIRRIPGVSQAGAISNFALTYNRGTSIVVESGACEGPLMDDAASPDFFATLSVPLRRGRFFSDADDRTASPVALVNESLGTRCWPLADTVGQRFRFADGRLGGAWVTVVGVIGDMRRSNVEKEGPAQIFLPLEQMPSRGVDFVVRTAGDAGEIESRVRRELAELDPRVPVYRASTLAEHMAATLVPRRFETGLLSLFAVVALFLAAGGIYGVMHYSVVQRTHEIGIRMAGGATPGGVVALVLRQGLRLASIGLLAGLCGVFLLNSVFSSLPLFGITAGDPVTFILVAGLLVTVAILACCVPAWRASTVDPWLALRHE